MAAGRSRRFGGDKRVAKFDDSQNLLQKSISLIAPHCSVILVVLKNEDKNQFNELLGDWQHDSRIRIVFAEDAEKGMGCSLANGVGFFLKWLETSGSQISGLLVMLADMPYIAPDTIQRVVDRHIDDKITYPCLDVIRLEKSWGHPVIFGKDCFHLLLRLTGDKGGRSIILNNPDKRREVIVSDKNILRDVDTPDDLIKSQKLNKD
ncbi:MAG: nucleotidyltransferase family protein [Cellvibrionaceae bacterium]